MKHYILLALSIFLFTVTNAQKAKIAPEEHTRKNEFTPSASQNSSCFRQSVRFWKAPLQLAAMNECMTTAITGFTGVKNKPGRSGERRPGH